MSVQICKLFEMINQEFEAYGKKFHVLPNFRICWSELGSPKLRVFTHVYAVSAQSLALES